MADRGDIAFASGDGRCAGWLYTQTGPGPSPCIVMAHGFGARKEARLDAFAERFAAEGWTVLVFDYRHFGDSTGEPRGLIHTKRQHEDWQAAVAYARWLEGVDPGRVAVWGSSNSGGHVMWLAARDRDLAAAVAQVPHADGPATMRLIGWRGSLKLAAAGMLDRLASVVGREHRIPIVAPPGTVGAMTAPEAEPGYSAMYPEGFDWDNSTPARIALSYGLYSPGRDSAKIACPLLVVVGTRDQTTPAGPARAAARRAPKGEVVSFSCGHFDVYVGEWFERAVAAEVEFLRRCLAAEPARAPRPA